MKPIFTHEDFDFNPAINKSAAFTANLKIKKLIESWPVVFTKGGEIWDGFYKESAHAIKKARLAFIEEIVNEKCKHQVSTKWDLLSEDTKIFSDDRVFKCKHCGVELMAEWREKK